MKKIKLVATDCDGVLTDGGLYYSSQGDTMRRFSVLDGIGFIKLKEHGVMTAIITAENNLTIKARADKLKVDYLSMGDSRKLDVIQRLCNQFNLTLDEVAYIGDDIADKSAIESVGFGAAPPNGMAEILDCAKFITNRRGGDGCFREVVEHLFTNNLV